MAEEHARWKQYEYAANSNLVLTADRRTREHEPSGEAESLAAVAKRQGKLFRMGDRVVHSKPQALVDKKDKIEKKRRERKDKDDARKKAKVRPTLPSVAPRRSAARRRSAFAALADCARVNPPFSAAMEVASPCAAACPVQPGPASLIPCTPSLKRTCFLCVRALARRRFAHAPTPWRPP